MGSLIKMRSIKKLIPTTPTHGDGMTDGEERERTDPLSPDTDKDGINDSNDAFPDANESLDTDGDGIGDSEDLDDDNDGLSDTQNLIWNRPSESRYR